MDVYVCVVVYVEVCVVLIDVVLVMVLVIGQMDVLIEVEVVKLV